MIRWDVGATVVYSSGVNPPSKVSSKSRCIEQKEREEEGGGKWIPKKGKKINWQKKPTRKKEKGRGTGRGGEGRRKKGGEEEEEEEEGEKKTKESNRGIWVFDERLQYPADTDVAGV